MNASGRDEVGTEGQCSFVLESSLVARDTDTLTSLATKLEAWWILIELSPMVTLSPDNL